jgi:hypothetical protein
MKQRKLVIGLLVMLAVAVSGFTFAFWAGSISVTQADVESMSITIGEGEAVTTSVTIGGGANTSLLVPAGRVNDSVDPGNASDSIELSFTVTWAGTDNATYNGNVGTLAAAVSNVLIGGSATNAGLVGTVVGGDATVVYNDADATVTVTVTLTEPTTQAVYNAIIGQAITFDVTFTVTPGAV